MNIQTMMRQAGNTNLQQVTRNNLQKSQPQNQAQQVKQNQQDEYIHEEVIQAKENAVIYSDSSKSANPAPQNAAGEFVEKDSEAVSFNPYTFNPEAMQEAKPAEIPPERTEGQSENGELSEEMPDLPPIPEDESGASNLGQKLPDKENSGDSKANNMAVRANDPGKAQQGGAPAAISTNESESEDDSSDDEAELENLELERARIRQNLNTEQDISKKESLRVELRSVESQINQLKAELSK